MRWLIALVVYNIILFLLLGQTLDLAKAFAANIIIIIVMLVLGLILFYPKSKDLDDM